MSPEAICERLLSGELRRRMDELSRPCPYEERKRRHREELEACETDEQRELVLSLHSLRFSHMFGRDPDIQRSMEAKSVATFERMGLTRDQAIYALAHAPEDFPWRQVAS